MTTKELIQELARRNAITVKELRGPGQQAHLVEARRQVAVALHKKRWSLTHIGRVLGSRHHTTVLHLLRKGTTSESDGYPVPDLSGEWAI